MQRKTSESASLASERVALDSWVSSDSHFVPKRASLSNATQMDSNQPPRPPLSKSGFSLGALGGWGRSLAAPCYPAAAPIDWPGSRLNPLAPSFAAMAVTGPFPAPHLLPSLAAKRASSSRASNLSANKTATPSKSDVTRLALPENEITDTCSEGGYDFGSTTSNGPHGSVSNSTYSTPRQSSSGTPMDWNRFGHSLRTSAAAAAAAGRPPSLGSGGHRAPSGCFSPAVSLGLPETPGLRSPECSPPRRTLSSSSLPPPPHAAAGPLAASTLPHGAAAPPQSGRSVRPDGGDSKAAPQQLMYVYGMEDAYLGGIVQREVEEARKVRELAQQPQPSGRIPNIAQPVPDYLVPTIAVKARSLVSPEEEIPNTATTAYATPKTDANFESHYLAPQLAGLTAMLDLPPDSEKPPGGYPPEPQGMPAIVKDKSWSASCMSAVERAPLVDEPTGQLLRVLAVRLYCAAVRQPAAAAIIAAVVACMAWWVVLAGMVLCGMKGAIHLARLPVVIAAAVAMWAVGKQGM